MWSIGKFAKMAGVSARTVRYYESLGLLRSAKRGENNYRYYDVGEVEVVARIRELQELGFSLEEIRDVLMVGVLDMRCALNGKLDQVNQDLLVLQERKARLQQLLQISSRVVCGSQTIELHERRLYMDAVREEVLSSLRNRNGGVSESQMDHLQRELTYYDTDKKRALFNAVKKCLAFADEHNLTLGPGRGASPASMILYGLGFTQIDPTIHGLLPERMLTHEPDIHIDVEFENGQKFVDFCRKQSEQLEWGKITAFKMPLLDIVNQVQSTIGERIDFDSVSDDDDRVLSLIRKGDIEKIFLLDYSPDALVMKYENHLDEYVGTEKIRSYLTTQEISSFRDVVNIIALWRPNCEEHLTRLERYKSVKLGKTLYDFLKPEILDYLLPNFGLVIYHEDIMQIISSYSGWDHMRSAKLRRDLFLSNENEDLGVFREIAPASVFDLVTNEARWSFCKSHAFTFARFTKMTSILKNLHRKTYLATIDTWEQKHGFRYDDIGIKLNGISLLQN